jgi:hypothetical protein
MGSRSRSPVLGSARTGPSHVAAEPASHPSARYRPDGASARPGNSAMDPPPGGTVGMLAALSRVEVLSPAELVTAVDGKHHARDPRGGVRGENVDGVGDVFGGPLPPEWRLGPSSRRGLRRDRRSALRSVGTEPGATEVSRMFRQAKLVGRGADEHVHACLGRRVGRQETGRAERVDRRNGP